MHMCTVCCLCVFISAGVLIYFGYGMWNSTLEITAREEEAHASTYQRYDMGVDDSFAVDDDLYPSGDKEPYQSWGSHEGSGGHQKPKHQEQSEPKPDGLDRVDNHRTSSSTSHSRAKSKAGKPSPGFEALVVDDDLDDPLEWECNLNVLVCQQMQNPWARSLCLCNEFLFYSYSFICSHFPILIG